MVGLRYFALVDQNLLKALELNEQRLVHFNLDEVLLFVVGLLLLGVVVALFCLHLRHFPSDFNFLLLLRSLVA